MFIKSVGLDPIRDDTYVRDLPVVRHLARHGRLRLTAPVTLLIGDNGAGKSTLVEAIAVAAGFDAAGGPLRAAEFRGQVNGTESTLSRWLTLRGKTIPPRGYFLRAETHYDTVTLLGTGRRHHEMSHGESVLSVLGEQMGGAGLYVFDEPESGLSVIRQMALVAEIDQAVLRGGQFIIATHSPIMMAIPNAAIIQITEKGMSETVFEEAEAVLAMREFLDDPKETIRYIMGRKY